MRNHIRTTLALCSFIALTVVLGVLLTRGQPAVAASATEMQTAASSPPSPEPAAAVEEPRVEHGPLYDYLRPLVEQLADSYAERPGSGSKHAERPDLRQYRLDEFTSDIERAFRDDWRTPMLRERGEDWKYAATLVWIAHRETRIARNPRVLGNEDAGHAHGPWQVWAWKGLSQWLASTALDMLIENPGAWSLPKGTPWLGYPDCEKWVREHPFKQ